MVFGDDAGFAESAGDPLLVALGVGEPAIHAAGRIRPHGPIGPHAELAEHLGDAAALADLVEKVCAIFRPTHRRTAAGPLPDGRHDSADLERSSRRLVGQFLDRVVALNRGVDIDVRQVEEQVEPVELRAVHLGRSRQVEHRVEVDRRLVPRAALAHGAGPCRVVEFRIIIGVLRAHAASFCWIKFDGSRSAGGHQQPLLTLWTHWPISISRTHVRRAQSMHDPIAGLTPDAADENMLRTDELLVGARWIHFVLFTAYFRWSPILGVFLWTFGPKYRRPTSGSPLVFSITTPAVAASGVIKNSSHGSSPK